MHNDDQNIMFLRFGLNKVISFCKSNKLIYILLTLSQNSAMVESHDLVFSHVTIRLLNQAIKVVATGAKFICLCVI